MKLKGLNICSFDPFDDFGLPKGTRYRQMNNPFIAFGIVYDTITFDTSTNSSSDGGTTGTITIGSNSNRILIAHISYGRTKTTGYTPTAVKIGSTNFTKLTDKEGDGSSFGHYTSIWFLIAPPTGAQTVTVTWGTTPTYSMISLISLYNVDQSTGISASTFTTAGGACVNPSTLNITPTTTGSWIIACGGTEIGFSAPNHTAIYTNVSNPGADFGASAQYNSSPTIGSSNTLSWTSTASSTLGYSIVAFEVLAHHTP